MTDERRHKKAIYIELIPQIPRYSGADYIYGFTIGRHWVNKPRVETAGLVIKVTLDVPDALFFPKATTVVIDESHVVAS